MKETTSLGIDISKDKFDVALLVDEKPRHTCFQNSEPGFQLLAQWLASFDPATVHACMEFTGGYERPLAEFLFAAGYRVSIVNPARIRGFAQSQMVRLKTDKADAALIARFCALNNPVTWTPPGPELDLLQALVHRLDDLKAMRQQEVNRLDTARLPAQQSSIHKMVEFFDQQIAQLHLDIENHIAGSQRLSRDRELLLSIPGIGPITSIFLLLVDLRRFESSRQSAAFLGLTPKEHQSGSSVRGKTKLSKMGSSRLRSALFFPAMAAARCDPVFGAFRQRLLDSGKKKLVVVVAIMRKLLSVAFGVLKANVTYDPKLVSARAK